jgi:hypothetical protein
MFMRCTPFHASRSGITNGDQTLIYQQVDAVSALFVNGQIHFMSAYETAQQAAYLNAY